MWVLTASWSGYYIYWIKSIEKASKKPTDTEKTAGPIGATPSDSWKAGGGVWWEARGRSRVASIAV